MCASSKGEPLKIVVFPSDRWGCGYYRMLMPSMKLVERGHKVAIAWDYLNYPRDADVYHFQRITTPAGLRAMRALKAAGKLVMMDMDDDLFHLYPGHPSAWYFGKGYQCLNCGNAIMSSDMKKCPRCKSDNIEFQDRLKVCADAFGVIDWLTVSTPELQERFGMETRNMRSVVIPNFVDMRSFEGLPEKGEEYTAIGWFGSFTHTLDLSEIGGLVNILTEYPENHIFVTAGESSENLMKLLSPSDALLEHIHELSPVDLSEYPEILKNIDIGLAPIRDNQFNRCKSELKAMEYGAAGCPVIASAVAPYKRYIEHGVNGFLVNKPKEWKKYTKILLDDPELRKKMGRANLEKARTMDINHRIVEREEFYLSARDEHRNKTKGPQNSASKSPFLIGG